MPARDTPAGAASPRRRPWSAWSIEAKLHGRDVIDRALGTAAVAGRFLDDDLRSILSHQRHARFMPQQRSEDHSLQPGTASWSRLGRGGDQ